MVMAPSPSIDLTGVPETMLWPLWNRAWITRRQPGFLDDSLAVRLVAELDYDFAGKFGRPTRPHGIRARHGDDRVREHLTRHPGADVVALGEGLETQFWRLGRPEGRWLSIDVPEAIAMRRRLLPRDNHNLLIESSALDRSWMDAVDDTSGPPFVSAAGLLMYFTEAEVLGLLSAIARRFPGATVWFDTIPPIISARTIKGLDLTPRYRAPPMPWGISAARLPDFMTRCGLRIERLETFAEPYPSQMPVLNLASKVALIRNRLAPCLVTGRAGGLSSRSGQAAAVRSQGSRAGRSRQS